jgi:hypothetical protein
MVNCKGAQPAMSMQPLTTQPLTTFPPTASLPAPSATDQPIEFTSLGHRYTITYDAQGGATITRDGTSVYVMPTQMVQLQGQPPQEPLWGAASSSHSVNDYPEASFGNAPLGVLFGDPPSAR